MLDLVGIMFWFLDSVHKETPHGVKKHGHSKISNFFLKKTNRSEMHHFLKL